MINKKSVVLLVIWMENWPNKTVCFIDNRRLVEVQNDICTLSIYSFRNFTEVMLKVSDLRERSDF